MSKRPFFGGWTSLTVSPCLTVGPSLTVGVRFRLTRHRVFDLDANAAGIRHLGIARVTADVRNPASPEKTWEGLFLVETGAVDCLVSGRHLRELGIEARGKRKYELADGTEVTFEVGGAEIEFMGDRVYTTVIFGADDAEPILGVTTLESVGIEVDPRSQRRKRLPAVRLKSATPK